VSCSRQWHSIYFWNGKHKSWAAPRMWRLFGLWCNNNEQGCSLLAVWSWTKRLSVMLVHQVTRWAYIQIGGCYTKPHIALESIWSPHGVQGASMEFCRSLPGLHVDQSWYNPESFQTPWNLHGVHKDSTWSLHGVHKESSYNPHKEEDFSGSPFTVPQGLIKDSL